MMKKHHPLLFLSAVAFNFLKSITLNFTNITHVFPVFLQTAKPIKKNNKKYAPHFRCKKKEEFLNSNSCLFSLQFFTDLCETYGWPLKDAMHAG
jgi:hypothetical protein